MSSLRRLLLGTETVWVDVPESFSVRVRDVDECLSRLFVPFNIPRIRSRSSSKST